MALVRRHEAEDTRSLAEKLRDIDWPFAVLLAMLVAIGAAELFSVADGSFEPWAGPHLMRFAACFVLFIAVALTDIRFWMRMAYPIYGAALFGLVLVELVGVTYGGATRWLSVGGLNLQPSELMKIALVLALARTFQGLDARAVSQPRNLLLPAVLIAVPTLLVAAEPDLGTALLVAITGALVLVAAGVHWLYFLGAGITAAAAAPFAWGALHAYQKARILTFLDPERDPLGAGYHIIQAKIALGSGGAFGRGFGQGTQSHLDFVPEKHTDFIFTMLGEEFGFAGALVIIALYAAVALMGLRIATRVENRFGRLVAAGVAMTLFAYVFVNIAMVTGLLPVVGVPLPLISHGGTVMLSVMFGLGLMMSAHVHRHMNMPRPLARRR